jgi:hypothetical protein
MGCLIGLPFDAGWRSANEANGYGSDGEIKRVGTPQGTYIVDAKKADLKSAVEVLIRAICQVGIQRLQIRTTIDRLLIITRPDLCDLCPLFFHSWALGLSHLFFF